MKNLEETVMGIGAKLRQLRVEAGYTNHETFALEIGMHRMQYWRMENGKSNFTIKSLLKILAFHGMTVEEFFSMEVTSTA